MYGQSQLYEYTHCAKMSNENGIRKARPDGLTGFHEPFQQNTLKMSLKTKIIITENRLYLSDNIKLRS